MIDHERKIYTVSQITKDIKTTLESQYKSVWVQGEISNFKHAPSGHMYFTLKDELSQIRAVLFRGQAQFLKFKPENGTEVITWGRLSLYEPRGDYQLILDTMEPKGLGALALAYEQLKEKLLLEGLFDESRKRELPRFPYTIGLVTSARGAAVRDMVRIIQRRAPYISIIVSPCLVQGDRAPKEIISALERISAVPELDLIIIGRGGGAIEDLWAFNAEEVVRAVANCPLPTISAVGHETDFTLTDFAADIRASTPSAAAEMAAPDIRETREGLIAISSRLRNSIYNELERAADKLQDITSRLKDPGGRLEESRMRVDDLSMRLASAMKRSITDLVKERNTLNERLKAEHILRKINRNRERLSDLNMKLINVARSMTNEDSSRVQELSARLQALNPYEVLARGYSIATKVSTGKIITDSGQVDVSEEIELKLARGKINLSVTATADID